MEGQSVSILRQNCGIHIDRSIYVKGSLFIAEKDAVICNAIYFLLTEMKL